jgi:hypothetical protein
MIIIDKITVIIIIIRFLPVSASAAGSRSSLLRNTTAVVSRNTQPQNHRKPPSVTKPSSCQLHKGDNKSPY